MEIRIVMYSLDKNGYILDRLDTGELLVVDDWEQATFFSNYEDAEDYLKINQKRIVETLESRVWFTRRVYIL